MREFRIPKKEGVAEHNRKLFYVLENSMKFVPNVFAFMAHSDTALEAYLNFRDYPTVFKDCEAELIQLITSQLNKSPYCLSAHTVAAKDAGLKEKQIEEIRKGHVSFDKKWDILAKFTCELVNNRGAVKPELIELFYETGYSDAHLVDLIMLVGSTIITNYLTVVTKMPIDFPEAPVIICNCDCEK